MKIIIGCLAVIGLLAVLTVGGCLGLVGLVFSSMPTIPPYATTEKIEQAYKKDLAIIEQYLDKKDATLLSQLSTDVYALYDDDDELLKRHEINEKSFIIFNGAGNGKLTIGRQKIICMTYSMKSGERNYQVFIFDKNAEENKPVQLEATP
jgi:hypothetical protein